MMDQGWVQDATLPLALLASDGTIASRSAPWDRLFARATTGSDGTLASLVAVTDRAAVGEFATNASRGATSEVDVRVGGEHARWVKLQATIVLGSNEVLVVATDVTASRAELDELRDRIGFLDWQALSLSTFTKAMQHARVILFSMDPTGITTMSDGKGLELLGKQPGQDIGQNELEATTGTPSHDHLLRALQGDVFRELVERAPGVFFDTWYMPLRNENDECDGVLSLSVDATDRVRSEQQLERKMTLIEEQSETIRDLSAPIIKIWDEVVCMPIVGGVDASRVTEMMAGLLDAISTEQARFAILDLTGVHVMDTSTVEHILRIFRAARNLGARGVLSGVQPAVAQTIVALGVDLTGLRMMRTLHDALGWCLSEQISEERIRSNSRQLRG